jgi:predicted DNA-binding transcriptional regulator AlpA
VRSASSSTLTNYAPLSERLSLLELDPVIQAVVGTLLPVSWCEPLIGLAHSTQRELVRLLDTERLSKGEWARLCGKVADRTVDVPMFEGDTFALSTETWSLELGSYIDEAREASALEAELSIQSDEMKPDDLLGPAEIAELLEVSRETVYKWQTRGLLPAPFATYSGTSVWQRKAVVRWAIQSGRIAELNGTLEPWRAPGGRPSRSP